MLRAGLDGVRHEIPAPAPNEEDLYHLDEAALARLTAMPGSLGEAIGELQGSELVKSTLGDHLFERYVEAKRQEWDDYRISVSAWELERYLPIY
jgi:glutamine synthetase